jgi:trans-2-enoyl-CoA reductase
MKVSVEQLKKIIREEASRLVEDSDYMYLDRLYDVERDLYDLRNLLERVADDEGIDDAVVRHVRAAWQEMSNAVKMMEGGSPVPTPSAARRRAGGYMDVG